MPGNHPCWQPCNCIKCAKFSAVCECCQRTFTTYPSYRRHLTAKKAAKRGPKTAPTAAIVPEGDGFLKRVLANKSQLARYNLEVMSRFCAALNEGRSRNVKFTRAHKNLLREISEKAPHLVPFTVHITSDQAAQVLSLAQTINVPPSPVVSLLVSYGLEHLVQELRKNSVAPPVATPNVEKKVIVKRQTASEEFLKEQNPDMENKQVTYEHTIIRPPTPVIPDKRTLFPSV